MQNYYIFPSLESYIIKVRYAESEWLLHFLQQLHSYFLLAQYANLIIVYSVKLPFFHCLQIVFECKFIVLL